MDAHRVLIIDNDLHSAGRLARALKSMGLQVEEASDSRLALEKLHTSCDDFDLIFIEQRMPAFSGIDILKDIQSSNCKSRSSTGSMMQQFMFTQRDLFTNPASCIMRQGS